MKLGFEEEFVSAVRALIDALRRQQSEAPEAFADSPEERLLNRLVAATELYERQKHGQN